MKHQSGIAYFARVNFRGDRRIFGIKPADRLHHMYIVGATGAGKTSLLSTLIQHDLRAGNGITVIDPHGDLAETARFAVPRSRKAATVYLDPSVDSCGYSFNPFTGVPVKQRPVAAEALVDAFRTTWSDSWGPRLEHLLRNSALALLDYPAATLYSLLGLLQSEEFRKAVMTHVQSQVVRRFWQVEYASYPARFRVEVNAPLENKVGAFLSNHFLFRLFTAKSRRIDVLKIMNGRGVLIANLAKGKIGADASRLLGALLVASVKTASLSRASLPPSKRAPHLLYLDEFHSFATQGMAEMLAELRKYGTGLVLANQGTGQLDPKVRDAVIGNCGTIVCFRVRLADAETMESILFPEFSKRDLARLPNHMFYIRLLIDGRVSRPFSAETIKPGKSDL